MPSIVIQQESTSGLSFPSDIEDLQQILDTTDLAINFEEFASLHNDFSEMDINNKVLVDNEVPLDSPESTCMVVLEHAAQDTTLTQVQEFQPSSPDMFLPQPVSRGISIESALSPYSSLSLSPDALMPEPASVEPASPDQHYTLVWPSQPVVVQSPPQPSVEDIPSPDTLQQIKDETSSFQSFGNAANAPKKRGRKRKYPEGTAPRRRRPRKTKVYEMEPLQDEELEKKRRNAITAKLHRDRQKNERDVLAQQLKEVTAERDDLLKEVEELKRSQAMLHKNIRALEVRRLQEAG